MLKRRCFDVEVLVIVALCMLFIACEFEDNTPPYPPPEIGYVHWLEHTTDNKIATIQFTHVPRHFSVKARFFIGYQGFNDICWQGGQECYEVEVRDLTPEITVTWEGKEVQLAIMEGEPIWDATLHVEMEYSEYAEYEDSRYSLTSEHKNATIRHEFRHKVSGWGVLLIATLAESLITGESLVGKDATYVTKGEPFRLIHIFDRPPPAIQIVKDGFAWCKPADHGFSDLDCTWMDSTPVYNCERQGPVEVGEAKVPVNVFVCTFPEGISGVPFGYDQFSFQIVWGLGTDAWIKRSAQIRMLDK